MSMYCVQINKTLQLLKSDKWSTKHNLYVVLTYGNQKRRTTCKTAKDDSHIWYESFLFILDESKNKNIKIEIYDKNNKKNVPLVCEEFLINRLNLVAKNTKYLEIQHGVLTYENERKIKKLEGEIATLSDKNQNQVDEITKLKELITNISQLINKYA